MFFLKHESNKSSEGSNIEQITYDNGKLPPYGGQQPRNSGMYAIKKKSMIINI